MRNAFRILTALLLLVPYGALAAGGDLVDLDGTPWGASREDIERTFGLPPQDSSRDIIFPGAALNGHDAAFIYMFRDNRLAAMNVQTGSGLTQDDAAGLEQALRELMLTTYGTPLMQDALCPGRAEGCTYAKWNKNPETYVVLQHETAPQPRVTIIYGSTAIRQEAAVFSAVLAEFSGATAPTVEIRETSADSMRVVLTADEPLQSENEARAMGTKGVTGAVKALMAAGINLGNGSVAVSCWVYSREGTGLTGKKLVRQYGVARYNPATDGVEWAPAK